jgi:hypothetical protein
MESSASKMGATTAVLWLRILKSVRAANSACTAWTSRQGLPAFIGRLPVPLACFAILTVSLICGFLIGSIVILFSIFIYMLCNFADNNVDDSDDSDDTDELSGHQYREGNDGYGMYSGPQNVTVTSSRIDRDDEDD